MYPITKRFLDIVAGILGLIAYGAIGPLVALALILEGRREIWDQRLVVGPDRRGLGRGFLGTDRRKVWHPGRPLTLRFFRTVGEADPQGNSTAVGRFLSRTGLAGLPLSWSLLVGDISLVGPHFLDLGDYLRCRARLTDEAPAHLLLPPGMTGLSQLADGLGHGPGLVLRRLSLDRQYLQRCGPRLDLAILLFALLEWVGGRRTEA